MDMLRALVYRFYNKFLSIGGIRVSTCPGSVAGVAMLCYNPEIYY